MPAKKAKTTKPEDKSVETPVQPEVVGAPAGMVVVAPPAEEEKPGENPQPEKKEAVVQEGELASAIADLAKVVDNSQPTQTVVNKEFVPAELSVETKTENLQETLPKKKSTKAGLGLILAFLVGFGLGFGIGYWLWGSNLTQVTKKDDKPVEVITPKATPTAPAAVTPTAAVKVDRSKLKVQVLNGNGGKGVAAKAQELLEEAGYKDVAVGNADSEDYKETEIAIKAAKKEYFETLKADLAKSYQVATAASTLAASSIYDAVVTIGLK